MQGGFFIEKAKKSSLSCEKPILYYVFRMGDEHGKQQITPIGKTDWRNSNQVFGIKDKDRLNHIYAIGKSGTGKSTLLLNMAISDIERGNGLCVIDPHGDLAESVLNYIPEKKINDVIYFNATDADFPIGFNPLCNVPPENHILVASGLISTFKKIWSDSWGPRLEHILRFSILSLLHHPKATLLDIQPLLTDTYFRNGVINYITDPGILNFWQNEFDKYLPALKSEVIAPILNKVGLLTASSLLRNIVGQQNTRLNIKEVMDSSKILICNLSKGVIGEDSSALLGAIILTAIQSSALARSSYEPDKRIPFYLYVDEMHSFVTLSLVDTLAEARKYGLSLFLTHQYIEQIDEKIRSAIFGNVGTMISFRVGATDAEYLAREFYPAFKEDDLVNLPRHSLYLKLMIDGTTSKPFSAVTIPIKEIFHSLKHEVIHASRMKYATEAHEVQSFLNRKYSSSGNNREKTLFDHDA